MTHREIKKQAFDSSSIQSSSVEHSFKRFSGKLWPDLANPVEILGLTFRTI
jgi:hypothetical protein